MTEVDYAFKHSYKLYFTGTYGKSSCSTSTWERKIKPITENGSIASIAEFWRLVNRIPTLQDANDGFSYHWFKEDISPLWEAKENIDGSTIVLMIEEHEDIVKNDPDQWDAVKISFDAFVLHTLLLYMGNSLARFTEKVNGIVVKVRRTRLIVEFWAAKCTPEDHAFLEGILKRYRPEHKMRLVELSTSRNTDLLRDSRGHSRSSSRRTSKTGSRAGSAAK